MGVTTITWTLTDVNGNVATGTQIITVEDNEDPLITGMPTTQTESANVGECGRTVNWLEPVASDNCVITSFTSTHNSGDYFDVGTTTVSYTAVNGTGNVITENFSVVITDNEYPVISNVPLTWNHRF